MAGKPRRDTSLPEPKLANLKCHQGLWDLMRKICAARKCSQQVALDRYALPALKAEMHKIVREEYAAMKGEG
jgi:hypothetical protein